MRAPLAQKFSRIQRWEWSEQVRGLENERLGLDFLKAELSGQGLGLRVRCGMKGGGKVNFSGDLLREVLLEKMGLLDLVIRPVFRKFVSNPPTCCIYHA